MYKRLSPEDYTVDYMPIIEPGGVASDGTLVQGDDYEIYTGDLSVTLPTPGTPTANEDFRYRQIANMILGDSTSNGNSNKFPSSGIITFAVLNRTSFKESIHPSSFSAGGIRVKSGSNDVEFCEAGRVYRATDGSYYLYPDVGIVLKSGISPIGTIKACSEETKTISQAHIYASPSEFNYSMNPSFLDENDDIRFPAYKDFIGPYGSSKVDWINNPTVYITTIGFYNDNGDCLAVAKLPKAIKKDFQSTFSTTVEFKF